MTTLTKMILAVALILMGATVVLFFMQPASINRPAPSPEPVAPSDEPKPLADPVPGEPESVPDAVAEPVTPPPFENPVPTGDGIIHGSITTLDGAPLPPDIALTFASYPETYADFKGFEAETWTTPVNEDGTFRIENLPIQPYAVLADSATYTGSSSTYLRDDRREREVGIELYPAGAISGVVVNENGDAIPGATVLASAYFQNGREFSLGLRRSYGTETQSDTEGRFEVRYLQVRTPPLEYRLFANAEGFATHHSPAYRPNTNGVTLVLSQGAYASGVVVRADTGDPVPDLEVHIDKRPRLDATTAVVGEDGGFRLGPIEPGDYALGLKTEHWFVESDDAQFRIAASGADVEGLRLSVIPGGKISGRVFDEATGRGIANARMRASPTEGGLD